MSKGIVVLISAIAGIFALFQPARAEEAAPAAAAEPLYATVNGKPITQKDFLGAYASYVRQKYYHAQVPEDQLDPVRKEVGARLVERILLLEEAKRRGLAPDEQRIAQTIAEYDARYAASQAWQEKRASMLPGLERQLAEQDLLQQIEATGHAIAEPADEAVRAFYKARIELFTEPEKMRLHTILLKVDASAPKAAWDAARDEAARIVARLRSGDNSFEELAGLHSHDQSADKGGDMGYLHRGMIPEQVQSQLDERALGSVGAPIDVLEGVAIFRLDERIPAKVMPYENVAARARVLLKREQSNQAWETFIAGLRMSAVINVVEPMQPARPPANK
jgi:parvulin-like peptidyl-prolyl isomerase